jgi:hypothetical protein
VAVARSSYPTQALTLVLELLDGPGMADRELISTIQSSTAHLTHSLELMDRVLRQVPPGTEPGLVNLSNSLEFVGSVLRVHKSPVTIFGGDAPAPARPWCAACGNISVMPCSIFF